MPSGSAFAQALDFGKTAETKIARYLVEVRGCSILPVYEVLGGNYKGPRLYGQEGELVAPDMLAFTTKKTLVWIEAKHKSVFSWHRLSAAWTTGIDKHHYADYMRIAWDLGWPVWLLFLHENDSPDERDRPFCPATCPTGLFAVDVFAPVNHEHANWGPHGMVYWALEQLIRLEWPLASEKYADNKQGRVNR